MNIQAIETQALINNQESLRNLINQNTKRIEQEKKEINQLRENCQISEEEYDFRIDAIGYFKQGLVCLLKAETAIIDELHRRRVENRIHTLKEVLKYADNSEMSELQTEIKELEITLAELS